MRRADLVGLDVLGHRGQRHGARQLRDRLHHRFGARVLEHVAHEAAVDLEHADRQRAQVRQRAQAGAEVIQRDVAAELAQAPHQRLGARQIADGGALGQLEAQRRRIAGRCSSISLATCSVKSASCSDWPEKLIVNTIGLGSQQFGMRLEHLDRTADDPAIERRHQLVALRRRHEVIGTDDLAVLGRSCAAGSRNAAARVAAKRHDELRVELAAGPRRSRRAGR